MDLAFKEHFYSPLTLVTFTQAAMPTCDNTSNPKCCLIFIHYIIHTSMEQLSGVIWGSIWFPRTLRHAARSSRDQTADLLISGRPALSCMVYNMSENGEKWWSLVSQRWHLKSFVSSTTEIYYVYCERRKEIKTIFQFEKHVSFILHLILH